jgi:hypothetical protein
MQRTTLSSCGGSSKLVANKRSSIGRAAAHTRRYAGRGPRENMANRGSHSHPGLPGAAGAGVRTSMWWPSRMRGSSVRHPGSWASCRAFPQQRVMTRRRPCRRHRRVQGPVRHIPDEGAELGRRQRHHGHRQGRQGHLWRGREGRRPGEMPRPVPATESFSAPRQLARLMPRAVRHRRTPSLQVFVAGATGLTGARIVRCAATKRNQASNPAVYAASGHLLLPPGPNAAPCASRSPAAGSCWRRASASPRA